MRVSRIRHHHFVSFCMQSREWKEREAWERDVKDSGVCNPPDLSASARRGDVDDNFGRRLEDDEEHPDRTSNAVEVKVVV